MSEGLARRLLSGECAGKAFMRVTMLARVRHLISGKYFLGESLQLWWVESKAINFGDVSTQSDDHPLNVPAASESADRRTCVGQVEG